MGYRSEVGILITLPKNKTKDEIIKELSSKWDRKDFDQTFSVIELNEGECIFLHTKDVVKWYDNLYEDVKETMNWINDFENNYDSGGVHYLRIGESWEDVEEIMHGNEIKRYIEFYRYMDINEEE